MLLSLRNLRKFGDPKEFRHSSVFYFIDNTVNYYTGASGSSPKPPLHSLISQIQLLEIELDLHFIIIHIPGVVMIQQGTDGLSQGIWMSSLHSHMNEREILRAIFAPVLFH